MVTKSLKTVGKDLMTLIEQWVGGSWKPTLTQNMTWYGMECYWVTTLFCVTRLELCINVPCLQKFGRLFRKKDYWFKSLGLFVTLLSWNLLKSLVWGGEVQLRDLLARISFNPLSGSVKHSLKTCSRASGPVELWWWWWWWPLRPQ